MLYFTYLRDSWMIYVTTTIVDWFDAEGSGKQAQLVLTLSSLLKIQQRFVIHWHKLITVTRNLL